MKLLYQWLIVFALASLLFILRTYGGPVCSKPVPRTQLIIVKRVPSPVLEQAILDVPKVATTPPSKQRKKTRRRKLSKKERQSFARRLSQAIDDPDWDFCEVKMNQ